MAASTITFEAGSVTTLTNFTLTCTAGNLVTINSSAPGIQFNLLKPTGTANVNYLNIQDSNVTAGFFCNYDSINSGNNAGWNFTSPSVVQGGFNGFF